MDHSESSYTDLLPLEPHSAIICSQTACGKMVFALDLLETKYRGHFEHIIILYRTLKYNQTYKKRDWLHTDPEVYLVNPGERLNDNLRVFYGHIAGEPTLYIINDCNATKAFTKKKDILSELAFSGRHALQSVWVLTQKYNSVLTDLREQVRWRALFHCKDRDSFEALRENDVIPISEKYQVRKMLAETKHSLVIVKTDQPTGYSVVTNN